MSYSTGLAPIDLLLSPRLVPTALAVRPVGPEAHSGELEAWNRYMSDQGRCLGWIWLSLACDMSDTFDWEERSGLGIQSMPFPPRIYPHPGRIRTSGAFAKLLQSGSVSLNPAAGPHADVATRSDKGSRLCSCTLTSVGPIFSNSGVVA